MYKVRKENILQNKSGKEALKLIETKGLIM